MLFVGATNSDHFLSYHPLCFALFLMQLFQFFDPTLEVIPKINNFLIFGKKSISTKFKASIMPSDGSSKVKTGLPSTLFLIFHAAGISSFPLFNFLS